MVNENKSEAFVQGSDMVTDKSRMLLSSESGVLSSQFHSTIRYTVLGMKLSDVALFIRIHCVFVCIFIHELFQLPNLKHVTIVFSSSRIDNFTQSANFWVML